MSMYRNALFRTAVGVCGDVAIGASMASACLWIIQTASLGLFLSFLLWLVTAILSLAISQCVFRPAVRLVLSDRKLDDVVAIAHLFADVAATAGIQTGDVVARYARSALSALSARLRTA